MDYFYLLLQASLISVLAISLIIFVRLLLKNKLDRRVFILLWAVVLFRLLIVDSFSSPVSVAQILPQPQAVQSYLAQNKEISVQTKQPAGLNYGSDTDKASIIKQADNRQSEIPVLFSIWLIGATVMFTGTIMLYLLFQFRSRHVIYLADLGYPDILGKTKVYLSDQVTSPVTIGIFRPVIHLPDSIDFRDQMLVRHILTHEMIHVRRYDNLLKLVMLIALSLHWFNPFVWLLCRTLNKDIECSCDAAALAQLGEQSKSEYATTLVTMAEKSKEANLAGLVFVSFGSSFLKERVVNIMKKKTPVLLSATAGAVFSLALFAVFATNAPPLQAMVNRHNIANLTEQQAKELALSQTGGGEVEVCKKVNTVGLVKYIMVIRDKDSLHELEVDAYDGAILGYQKKPETLQAATQGQMISAEQALLAAQKLVHGGTVLKSRLKADKKGHRYDFTIVKDETKYELDIDAYSGEVSKYEKKAITEFKIKLTEEMLRPEQAQALALGQAGSGIVIKCTLDKKKEYAAPVYDVDVIRAGLKYKYHLHALDGSILKAETDYYYNKSNKL